MEKQDIHANKLYESSGESLNEVPRRLFTYGISLSYSQWIYHGEIINETIYSLTNRYIIKKKKKGFKKPYLRFLKLNLYIRIPCPTFLRKNISQQQNWERMQRERYQ